MTNKTGGRYTEAMRSYIFDRSSVFNPDFSTDIEKNYVEKAGQQLAKRPDGVVFVIN